HMGDNARSDHYSNLFSGDFQLSICYLLTWQRATSHLFFLGANLSTSSFLRSIARKTLNQNWRPLEGISGKAVVDLGHTKVQLTKIFAVIVCSVVLGLNPITTSRAMHDAQTSQAFDIQSPIGPHQLPGPLGAADYAMPHLLHAQIFLDGGGLMGEKEIDMKCASIKMIIIMTATPLYLWFWQAANIICAICMVHLEILIVGEGIKMMHLEMLNFHIHLSTHQMAYIRLRLFTTFYGLILGVIFIYYNYILCFNIMHNAT
ncbi:hypothetical protein ACJX0J_014684, partial [Zea mays]